MQEKNVKSGCYIHQVPLRLEAKKMLNGSTVTVTQTTGANAQQLLKGLSCQGL